MSNSSVDSIVLKGVRTNNLKNIDVTFPLGCISYVSGSSGSGKSSLVFDTLYAESYRRYLDSLSSFARQYIQAMPKPEVEQVLNLLPAVSVRQSRSFTNKRSTVGSLSEIDQLLEVIFAAYSQVYCPDCKLKVEKDRSEELVKAIFSYAFEGELVMILAPLGSYSQLGQKQLQTFLIEQGFSRIVAQGGKVEKIAEASCFEEAYVVIDRIKVSKKNVMRLEQSLELAFELGKGDALVVASDGELKTYSKNLSCNSCKKTFDQPSQYHFSYKHPLGACVSCEGLGLKTEIDWDKVFPDLSQSLQDQAIAPLRFSDHSSFYNELRKSARALQGIELNKAFSEYTEAQWHWIRYGIKGEFEGMMSYFKWLDTKRYKAHYRIHKAKYILYKECDACKGTRFGETCQSMFLNHSTISDVISLPIAKISQWLQQIQASELRADPSRALDKVVCHEALQEAKMRLHYLNSIGLGYLSLDRLAHTLSGGELQRLQMARALGNELTETLFCLDEPTVGLHPADTKRLIQILQDLKQQGNTIVLVEHEKMLLECADYQITIGPEAGHLGGQVVSEGPVSSIHSEFATHFSFTDEKQGDLDYIWLKNIRTNNLKDISLKLPLRRLTAVCGVSGSGKTSLVKGSLFPLLQAALNEGDENMPSQLKEARIGPAKFVNTLNQVYLVDQSPLTRSSRSNIATYLGVFDHIRKVLASQPEAKAKGFSASSFSFNVKGGRCEHCVGLGVVSEELSFLGEVTMTCPKCLGKRFNEEVLKVHFRGKSLLDLLDLTVSEAREIFYDHKKIAASLDHVIRLGLGYLRMGQSSSSFSGGEAQRVKLLGALKEQRSRKKEGGSLFIFDEPSSGLSDAEVQDLLMFFRHLTREGHTVVVIEHHVGLLKSSDYLVEIGPYASEAGGEVIYQGRPNGIVAHETSVTGPYLMQCR